MTLGVIMVFSELSATGILGFGYHYFFITSSRTVISMSVSPVFICTLSPQKWCATRVYFKHNIVCHCHQWDGHGRTVSPSHASCRLLYIICHTGLWRTDFPSLQLRPNVYISNACRVHIFPPTLALNKSTMPLSSICQVFRLLLNSSCGNLI
jgi:hypothetical protein